MSMTKISIQTRRIYSEVYGILDMLGKFYIEKLPNGIYKNIQQLKLEDYNPKYTKEKNLRMQNVSRDSISIIAFFHLSYWCEDSDEKLNLKKLFKENENDNNVDIFTNDNKIRLNEEEKIYKHNSNDNFKKKEMVNMVKKQKENANFPVEVKSDNILKRIMNCIKNFFNILDYILF